MTRTCFAALLTLCLTTPLAAADRLTLIDGRVLEGEYVGGNRASISFRVATQVERLPLASIRSLQFDPDRQPVAAAPAEPVSNARIVATGEGANALVIEPLPAAASN